MTKLHQDLSFVSSIPNICKPDSITIMGFMGANIGNYVFRLAHVLADKCNRQNIRDGYTVESLAKTDIKNTVVTKTN